MPNVGSTTNPYIARADDMGSDNIYTGSPIHGFNFVMRAGGSIIPIKSVHTFTKQNEYELIQEGGLNDYVHMVRKPIAAMQTFQVERYAFSSKEDPLYNGAEFKEPVYITVYANAVNGPAPEKDWSEQIARVYVFTGCKVVSKEYGGFDSEKSSIAVESITIAYSQLAVVTDLQDLYKGKPAAQSSRAGQNNSQDMPPAPPANENKPAAPPAASSAAPSAVENKPAAPPADEAKTAAPEPAKKDPVKEKLVETRDKTDDPEQKAALNEAIAKRDEELAKKEEPKKEEPKKEETRKEEPKKEEPKKEETKKEEPKKEETKKEEPKKEEPKKEEPKKEEPKKEEPKKEEPKSQSWLDQVVGTVKGVTEGLIDKYGSETDKNRWGVAKNILDKAKDVAEFVIDEVGSGKSIKEIINDSVDKAVGIASDMVGEYGSEEDKKRMAIAKDAISKTQDVANFVADEASSDKSIAEIISDSIGKATEISSEMVDKYGSEEDKKRMAVAKDALDKAKDVTEFVGETVGSDKSVAEIISDSINKATEISSEMVDKYGSEEDKKRMAVAKDVLDKAKDVTEFVGETVGSDKSAAEIISDTLSKATEISSEMVDKYGSEEDKKRMSVAKDVLDKAKDVTDFVGETVGSDKSAAEIISDSLSKATEISSEMVDKYGSEEDKKRMSVAKDVLDKAKDVTDFVGETVDSDKSVSEIINDSIDKAAGISSEMVDKYGSEADKNRMDTLLFR